MLVLSTTTDTLQVITSATSSINVVGAYQTLSGSSISQGSIQTKITTATTTALPGFSAPSSSTQNALLFLSLVNAGGAANTVTIQHYDGTNTVTIISVVLYPGYGLVYNETAGWFVMSLRGAGLL